MNRRKTNSTTSAITLLVVLCAICLLTPSVAATCEDEKMDYDAFYAGLIQVGYWWPTVLSVDVIDDKVLAVKLVPGFFTASDTDCQLFGYMMVYLTRNGWTVWILNKGWIPSESRIIDEDLAKKLAISY